MRYEQYPEKPEFAHPEYATKWLVGEWSYMTPDEEEELLLHYGPRTQRKAIKQRRKERAENLWKRSPVDLPPTLHGQLYLLAYDRTRHRFDGDNLWRFGFALSAAMLTDLYLTGQLEDNKGKPYPAMAARPADPVLRAVIDQIGVTGGRDWAQLIADNQKWARAVVRDQLEATGWLCVQQRRMLGITPTAHLVLYDEDMVSGLADQVTEALRNAIDGLPARPRPLAVGLLGVLGQMPTVLSFKESARHRQELRELTCAAIPPIMGLHQAIQTYHEGVRACMGGATCL